MGLAGYEYGMGDEWDICGSYRCGIKNGRYMGVTGVVYRMGDEWDICGSYRCGIQNGR